VDASDLLINGQPATNLTVSPGFPYVFNFPTPSTGTVNIAWAPANGITDLAPSANAFAGGNWTYTLDPSLPTNDIVINEILAANISVTNLLDEDGEVQDWIELHNRSAATINLENWALSDDPELPSLWTFPARTLGPGQFLVVFASGKDRRPTAANSNLHTNFKLSRTSEPLHLYNAEAPRRLVSGFTPFPEQRNDISFGYDPTNALRYFATPTPGASNGFSTIVGVVEPVHVNVSRGYFDAPFQLILSCPTPGATLRYTTNGAEPDANSAVFPASLTVSNTLLLRAAAFKTNHLPARTVTHTYLFNLPAAYRSLPAISIVTASNHLWGPTGIWGINGGNFNGTDGLWQSTGPNDYHNPSQRGEQWERPTSVEWIDPTGQDGFQSDCGIRISGSDYRRPRIQPTTKVSFRLYFRGDYGDTSLKFPLFPLTSVDEYDGIVLRGGFDDENNPFIRDETIRRLSHDMGQVSAHGTLGILFINGVARTNSPYYNPVERINDDFAQAYYGGGELWDVISQVSPSGSVVDGVRTDFESLVAYMDANNAANQTVFTNIAARLDLTNFADYLILNTWAITDDWPGNNWRAAREQGANKQWRFIVWDAEYGMGLDAPQYGTSLTVNNNPFTTVLPTGGGLVNGSEVARMYQNLKGNAEFKLLWADRVQKHFFNGGGMTRANVTNRIEVLRKDLLPLLPAMNTEFLTWAANREPIYFSQLQTEGLWPTVRPPAFNQHGGSIPAGFNLTITHTNATGSIYFTTDGTDPRTAFTGAIAPTASLYTNAIPLGASVIVKARVRQGTTWSPLTEATFNFASLGSPVCFSEIMYNPTGGSIYEFIEVLNPSTTPVDVGGSYFNGFTFIFPQGSVLPAGARWVLAANVDTNAWKVRYPGVNPVGWFGGSLNNAGERLEWFSADGRLLTSVDYLDTGGWPEAADVAGRSLELLNPYGDPDSPANWQASTTPNGTPGTTNSAAPTQTVWLNEIMADNQSAVANGSTFPDWVELHNPSNSPISVASWSLSDDGNERKFVFPAGTTVPARGFLVVWCDATTNITPGLHTGFNLAKDGETLSLYDAATNRIDAISLGLQIANLSVGRVSNQWVLNQPTPNATNTPATLGATTNLCLNEWIANPIPGQSDWVELFNASATLPVSLQGLYFTTSNNLQQLRALSFLRPGGHVQLFADQGVGPDHLDFNLSAAGDRVSLYNATGGLIQQVLITNTVEGLTAGRLPDGSATLTTFPGSASPGTTNYLAAYTGPVLNELLARNQSLLLNGRITDFLELRNNGASAFDLGGMSLSINRPKAAQWIFPPATTLAAGSNLVILCDAAQPASTNTGNFNLGEALDGESGGAYLFNAAGQLVNSVTYGLQVADRSIGLVSGQWRLLASPTPGTNNSVAATLSTNTTLRLNEWMAQATNGADWFELYNPATNPVDLATIALSDDPSLDAKLKFRPAPLSFIGPRSFVKWVADASPGEGLNHVNFGLDAQGDLLLLHGVNGTNATLLDAIGFGAQTAGVSVGRLLDGATNFVAFPGSPTPAASNYRLLNGLQITEILTHTDPPYEDAVELHNPGNTATNIGRWYLSDSATNFRKYQIPIGTTLTSNGYVAFYEAQFNAGATNNFTFDSAQGDEVWLSAADAAGNETGDRLVVQFGAAFNGVSFGRIATSSGIDFAPTLFPSFGVTNPASLTAFRTGAGALNPAPWISPVVVNEIFYHPPGGTNGDVEFVELHNRTAAPVMLFDPAYPTNQWRLSGGLAFRFPTNTTLNPGAFALIVDFDPATNAPAFAEFVTRYTVPTNTQIFGPFTGNLNNAGDEVLLLQPDTPQQPPATDAGFVPLVQVDRVRYGTALPWPVGLADGGGDSLQRSAAEAYGNEATNWFAAAPTPGQSNTFNPNADSDDDGIPDGAELALGLNPLDGADAALDPDGDGASNYEEYVAGTNRLDGNDRLSLNASADANGVLLSFNAVSNRTYSLLFKEDATATNWSKLLDIPAPGVTQPLVITNAATNFTRLYRLTTPALDP
jgi:hypothetical protein